MVCTVDIPTQECWHLIVDLAPVLKTHCVKDPPGAEQTTVWLIKLPAVQWWTIMLSENLLIWPCLCTRSTVTNWEFLGPRANLNQNYSGQGDGVGGKIWDQISRKKQNCVILCTLSWDGFVKVNLHHVKCIWQFSLHVSCCCVWKLFWIVLASEVCMHISYTDVHSASLCEHALSCSKHSDIPTYLTK